MYGLLLRTVPCPLTPPKLPIGSAIADRPLGVHYIKVRTTGPDSPDGSRELRTRHPRIPRPRDPRTKRLVVSFHTASDSVMIEELPLDDEQPDRGSRAANVYAGATAR